MSGQAINFDGEYSVRIEGGHLTLEPKRQEKEAEIDFRILLNAIDWVLSDAAYKPSEQIGVVGFRWLAKLQEARNTVGQS